MIVARAMIAVGLLSVTLSSALAGERSALPKYAIKAGKILTMKPVEEKEEAVEVINHGVILVSEAKIEAVGSAAGHCVSQRAVQ